MTDSAEEEEELCEKKHHGNMYNVLFVHETSVDGPSFSKCTPTHTTNNSCFYSTVAKYQSSLSSSSQSPSRIHPPHSLPIRHNFFYKDVEMIRQCDRERRLQLVRTVWIDGLDVDALIADMNLSYADIE